MKRVGYACTSDHNEGELVCFLYVSLTNFAVDGPRLSKRRRSYATPSNITKRAPICRGRNVGKLSRLLDMPVDILYEVCLIQLMLAQAP